MLIHYFSLFASHIIEVMVATLVVALTLRFLAYRAGEKNKNYYNTFSTALEKLLQSGDKKRKIPDVETWLSELLDQTISQLPSRALRGDINASGSKSTFRHHDRKGEIFSDYAEGKKSVSHAIKMNIDTFKSPHAPNYRELTTRVLNHDKKWRTVLKVIPVNTLSSMLAILPGLFIVGGIFGTFIGITAALPKVASIDLSNLDAATPVLSAFVSDVAYSMNTSIAGIICSVFMTVLNTLFPFHSMRIEVQRNLERCFEQVWYRIHGSETSAAEEEMLELLQEIRDNTKQQATSLKNISNSKAA